MLMPGRNYEAQNAYRFEFNGKQNDNDLKGEGNLQDYGLRMYDTRLGRFLSKEPLFRKYPYLSVYQFAGNNPIYNVDLDGSEGYSYWKYLLKVIFGIGPAPSSAEEAQQDEDLRVAYVHAGEDIHTIKENVDATIFSWVPGMTSIEKTQEGNYTQAGLFLIADLFGGELAGRVVKNIGLRLPLVTRFINKNLTGKGLNALTEIVGKTERLAQQLSDETITGAAKEIFGIPIENPKMNPSPDGHVKKVQQALQGLINTIDDLRSKIETGVFTGDVAKEAERVAKNLQKEKDRITNQLNKVIKKASQKG